MFLEAGSLNCFKFHLNITLIGKNWTSSHENPNKLKRLKEIEIQLTLSSPPS